MKSFQHFLIMDKGWEVRTKYKIKPKINNNKLKKGPKIAHITFIFQTWFTTHTHTHTHTHTTTKEETNKKTTHLTYIYSSRPMVSAPFPYLSIRLKSTRLLLLY